MSPPVSAALARVCEETGVTYRQVDHWVRLGLLHPEGKTGQGYSRIWPEHELAVLHRMARLVKSGVSVPVAHSVARSPTGYTVTIGPGIRVIVDQPWRETDAQEQDGTAREAGADAGPAAEAG